ncbi:unnamed protein product [Brachionus calyciflorus]|uniref:Uncharacterized protein n=1 Tax=Brachionus calyciflorus TaxID=104777 RepID=A0A814EQF5_9BILA|nr:unnamed protein product [Brachionus calyciflorus]
MYKLINNFESVYFVNGIKFNSKISGENKIYNLRRHSRTIFREKTGKCPSRFNFLSNKIINNWNHLTQETIEAKNLNSFKSKIDEWLLNRRTTTTTTTTPTTTTKLNLIEITI